MSAASCPKCNVLFALAEKRVRHEGREYHEDCARRIRADRIKELFILHAADHGLKVVPHRSHDWKPAA